MVSSARIQAAREFLLAALAVLLAAVAVGGAVAYGTVQANTHRRFVPGSGLYMVHVKPAGSVASGLHLPLGGER